MRNARQLRASRALGRPLGGSAVGAALLRAPCPSGLGWKLRLTAVEDSEVVAAPVRAGTVGRCGPFGRFRG
jgi:hypothetical protein